MNTLYFLLILAIIIPALALLGHIMVAYRLAPERAKQGILEALINDVDFQSSIVVSIVNNFMKTQKDGSGKEFIPLDIFIQRAKDSFKTYFEGQSKGLEKEMDEALETGALTQNPMMGIVLSQIPKKYRGVVLMAMNYMGNNQNTY